jgi:hypothetical protein
MLRRFAASISASRDWCGFWEINKDGFPAPIDYRDDPHFWYCLPANFDVMAACYRHLSVSVCKPGSNEDRPPELTLKQH